MAAYVLVNIKISFQKFFPVNKLRNLAKMLVQTPLVFVVDVDFVPSSHLQKHVDTLVRDGFFQENNTVGFAYTIIIYIFRYLPSKRGGRNEAGEGGAGEGRGGWGGERGEGGEGGRNSGREGGGHGILQQDFSSKL